MTVAERLITINSKFQALHYFQNGDIYVTSAGEVVSEFKEFIVGLSNQTGRSDDQIKQFVSHAERIAAELKNSENFSHKSAWYQKEKWLLGVKGEFLNICHELHRLLGALSGDVLGLEL